MGEFRLDFRLGHAGFDELQHPSNTLLGDLRGLPDDLDFRRRLDNAEPMHQPGQPLVIVERIPPPAIGHETRLARLDLDDRALVLVRVQVNVLALAHEPVKALGKLGQPVHLVDPGQLARLVLAQLVPFPRLEQRIRLPHKQHLALLGVIRFRAEQQEALFLFDAGEIEEVRVRAQRDGAVGVGRQHVVGVDNGNRARQQQPLEALAVRHKQLGIGRRVTHGLESVEIHAQNSARSGRQKQAQVQQPKCSGAKTCLSCHGFRLGSNQPAFQVKCHGDRSDDIKNW